MIKLFVLTVVVLVPALGARAQANPSAGLVMTPATFSVLNPSVFGDNAPAVVGGNYGHRPDAKTYLFSASTSHVRFQFGRTVWPYPTRAKTLMTSLDYAREMFSRRLGPSLWVVSGVQGSVGYGILNFMDGTGTEGVAAGVLMAAGARFSGPGFRLTPYLAPGYYFARQAVVGYECGTPSSCEDLTRSGFRFSFGGGLRLDLLQRISLEAGVRKTQTPRAISRRSFGLAYRFGDLDGRGLRDAGTFVLQMDNDFLARHNTVLDEDYTQGFHFSFNRKGAPATLRKALAAIESCPVAEGCVTRASVLLGQEIYTPQYYPSIAGGDRPFAGWLYSGAQSIAVTEHGLTSVGVKFGVTGPPSLAQQLQVTFHQMVPSYPIPPGWEGQLKFEPGLIVTVAKKNFSEQRVGSASLGVIRSGSVSLGNILSDAEGGVTLRAGFNPQHPWQLEKHHRLGGYASFGARGDVVLHNLFLDGNTFRGGPRVERIPFVWQKELAAGISMGSISLDYRKTVRSKEFTTGRRYHLYGTISLTRHGAF